MNIFILLTPFHIQQLKVVSSQFNIDLNNAIFLSPESILKEKIESVLDTTSINHIEIPQFPFLLSKVLKKPFTEIPKYKNAIKSYKQFIDGNPVLKSSKDVNLFICSDKHIFTQLLISNLSRNNKLINLSALDEGIGFYREISIKSKIFGIIYPILTPLLFGQKLNYFSQLGTHPMIQNVYARFPDEIPNKKKKVNYFKINPLKQETSNKTVGNRFLIFTSPLSEYGIIDSDIELKVLKTLFEVLERKKINYNLKPHPAELKDKYNFIDNVQSILLDPSKTAENIDYSEYKFFIHLGSSIILDLYSKGVKLENIITIDPEFFSSRITDYLFEKGVHIKFYSKDFKSIFEKKIDSLISKNEN